MSRRRQEKRHKDKELARQLGDADVDADTLKDRARVSRPVLRVVSHQPRGLLNKLLGGKQHLVLALYLVDSTGAHLLDATALSAGEKRLDKITYHRPAHFVLLACTTREPSSLLPAFAQLPLIDDTPLDAPSLAGVEAPRAVKLTGLPDIERGVCVSVRGVGRAVARHELPLEGSVAVVEIEV